MTHPSPPILVEAKVDMPYRPIPLARQVVLCKDCRHCVNPHAGWDAKCDINVKEVSYVDGRRTLKFCTSVNQNGECEDFEPRTNVIDKKKPRNKNVEIFWNAFVIGNFSGSIILLLVLSALGLLK